MTLVTFIATVILTSVAIFFCKRYFRKRRGPRSSCPADESMTENHLCRMTCSSSNAPLVPFSPSIASVSLINPLLHSYLSPAITEQQQQQFLNHRHMLTHSPSDTTTTTTTSTTTGQSDANTLLRSLSLVNDLPGYPPPPYQSTTSISMIQEDSGGNTDK